MKKTTTKPTTPAIKTPNRIQPKAKKAILDKWAKRPLATQVMNRVKSIIEKSGRKITVATLAADIGAYKQEVAEWVGMWRSAPSFETGLKMMKWAYEHEQTNGKGK